MESSSSSSSVSDSQYCPRWKYDVFLSFRGADTRRTFTGHLYEGLKNRGIFTFQDDKRLENGDSIPEELLKAIEESQVALVIFSKNYASSRWCLDELVNIMECKEEENGQTVIPIFYDVDPSHVRYQSESFAEAFAKHESRYKDDVEGMQKVQGWRAALTAAANLKGYDIRDGVDIILGGIIIFPTVITNFEIKTFDGSANPHLGLASIIIAGIDGMRRKLPIPEPGEPESYEFDWNNDEIKLPATLRCAIIHMDSNKWFNEMMGQEFIYTRGGVVSDEIGHDLCGGEEKFKHIMFNY